MYVYADLLIVSMTSVEVVFHDRLLLNQELVSPLCILSPR